MPPNLLQPDQRAALEAKLKAYEDKTSRPGRRRDGPGPRRPERSRITPTACSGPGSSARRRPTTACCCWSRPKERKVRIEVGYGLEGALTDALSKVIITTAIAPAVQEGRFRRRHRGRRRRDPVDPHRRRRGMAAPRRGPRRIARRAVDPDHRLPDRGDPAVHPVPRPCAGAGGPGTPAHRRGGRWITAVPGGVSGGGWCGGSGGGARAGAASRAAAARRAAAAPRGAGRWELVDDLGARASPPRPGDPRRRGR